MKLLIASLALVAASVVSANAQAPSPNANVTGDNQFCLSGSGNANCIYQTMAACESAKQLVSSTGRCVDRALLSGTVGSGAPSPQPANPPAGSPPR
jgi:hypothetical protein